MRSGTTAEVRTEEPQEGSNEEHQATMSTGQKNAGFFIAEFVNGSLPN
jgi:hypothetical protein